MSGKAFTRAERRRLQALADDIDRVSQADRQFLERRPDRRHHVRLASRAEIEAHQVTTGFNCCGHGRRLWVAVRDIAPGHRMRLMFAGPAVLDEVISEDEAKFLFDLHRTEQTDRIEASLQAAIDNKP